MVTLKLSPDLEHVRREGGRIDHQRDADDCGPYDFDGRTFDDLRWRQKLPSWAEWQPRPLLRPTNLKVHDPNVVASLAESLEEMVALMRAPLNPVRFLEDENSQVGLPRTVSATPNYSKGFLSASSICRAP